MNEHPTSIPTLTPFDHMDSTEIDAITTLWNESCSDDLPISARFVTYNVAPLVGYQQAGQLAMVDGEIVGAVFVRCKDDVTPRPADRAVSTGWVELLVVHPLYRSRGIGTLLLEWAEGWLSDWGCQQVALGGSLRPFFPGLPAELDLATFFQQRGYQEYNRVWDLAANLATYQPPESLRAIDGVVRPLQPSEVELCEEFLAREFPGRWYTAFQWMQQEPTPRLADYMILWTERGIDGFCRLTFADSPAPIERYYPYALPRPWGQLGTVGVAADQRGRGFGLAIVDAGLRRLHNNGVNGCIIDWTTIVDFYGKLGFQKHREYVQLSKSLKIVSG